MGSSLAVGNLRRIAAEALHKKTGLQHTAVDKSTVEQAVHTAVDRRTVEQAVHT
jgi:hypothetical protein